MTGCVVHGRLLLGNTFHEGTVHIEGGRIVAIERERSNEPQSRSTLSGVLVAPGFIDLQVNGGFGCAVEDGTEALASLARRLPESGVTAFLPTVITAPRTVYLRVFDAYRALRGPVPGAQPLGLHLEGPVLSPRRAGAHKPEYMVDGNSSVVDELLEESDLRLMTIAPERRGALRLIEKARARGVLASLGHSDACMEEFAAGVDAGAGMATHLFNAMSPFGHRSPGAAGAALLDDRLTVGLIADGIHCCSAALELAFRVKGADGIALVTDMVSAAGMPDGTYRIGDQWVEARHGVVRRPDGTLAGSALLMDAAVRIMVRETSATAPEALRMASEVPARLLGLDDRGSFRVGARADLVVLDGGLNVKGTMVGGTWAFGGEPA